MKLIDLSILLLEDGDPYAAFNNIDESLESLCIDKDISNTSKARWKIRLGSCEVNVTVTAHNRLCDIDTVLSPSDNTEREFVDSFDLILLDNAWEEAKGTISEGLDRLKKHRWHNPTGPLLAIYTGHADFDPKFVEQALDAGANALVKKNESTHFVNLLYFTVERADWRDQQRRAQREIDAILGEPAWANRLIARSDKMKAVLREVVAIATYDHMPVHFEGPAGTGKTLLAKLVHALSRRSRGPFIPAYLEQCPDNLFDPEFLGTARRDEQDIELRIGLLSLADGGTLFINGLQSISRNHQDLIRNVIEHKRYKRVGDNKESLCDVRFIFATPQPLKQLVEHGKISQEFANRTGLFTVRVPTLAERRDDIDDLARAAIAQWHEQVEDEYPPPRLLPDTVEYLKTYQFADNVLGLHKAIERACVRSQRAPELLVKHFDQIQYAEPTANELLSPGDYLRLARIGPRDNSSQRIVFDLLVSTSPKAVPDEELLNQTKTEKAALHVVISRLNRRLEDTPYKVNRDHDHKGYYLIKGIA